MRAKRTNATKRARETENKSEKRSGDRLWHRISSNETRLDMVLTVLPRNKHNFIYYGSSRSDGDIVLTAP